MRTYLVTYNYPELYRGCYLTTATDGIEASDKIKNYLHDKYEYAGDEVSAVTEIHNGAIQVVA